MDASNRSTRAGPLRLRPPQKRRLADVLYGQLLEQIVAGVLKPGDRLPAENMICAAFGVSRPVVREALMRLQADGLVKSRRGSGSFVLRTPSAALTRFVEPTDLAGYLRSFEVRIALEPVAARLAAQRHAPADLTMIREAMEALEAALATGRDGRGEDLAFHRAVAVASGNELFARLLDALGREVEGAMTAALGLTRLGSPERRGRVLQEHVQIHDAIAGGDGELAALYMHYHLSQARRRLTDAEGEP